MSPYQKIGSLIDVAFQDVLRMSEIEESIMPQNEANILILKPTSVFLSFLATQLPDVDLPDIRSLQEDHTAYTIPKQESDEATLDEIERQFPKMFRYEINRILGEEANDYAVEGSFLDFLCCFKFELHSQIVLMENSIDNGRQLLCVKPRSILLKWMKASMDDQIEVSNVLGQIDVSHFVENATVLVKNFQQLADIKPFMRHYYRPIFKAEMLRMWDQAEQWPEVDSFQDFTRYFAVEVHTQLVHLH